MHALREACRAGACALLVMAAGCANQAQVQVAATAATVATAAGKPVAVRLERCLDRTATKSRDLAAEATRLIEDRLRGTVHFELREDAPLVLTCEVTQFIEGSAFKRWLMPGWGSTVGQLSLMVSSAKDQSVVVIVHGNATVSAGGLYTVGAEDYILKSAADDVVSKLRDWAAGADPASIKR